MADSIDMPMTIGRVKRLNRLIPGISGQVAQAFEESSGRKRQIVADWKMAFLHVQDVYE
jgi:hypothetical protein